MTPAPTERDRIIAYIESRAASYRAKADDGRPGWASLRHDATTLRALASDLRAGLYRDGEESAGDGV